MTNGKYRPLGDYLQGVKGESCKLRFREIESIIGFQPPASAYSYEAWWGNETSGHVQAKAWINAGWQVESHGLDLRGKSVRFSRRQ